MLLLDFLQLPTSSVEDEMFEYTQHRRIYYLMCCLNIGQRNTSIQTPEIRYRSSVQSAQPIFCCCFAKSWGGVTRSAWIDGKCNKHVSRQTKSIV